MAVSKANRILILLVIDTLFFLVEVVTGYAVHSLALVADAYHMLNDVLSLCVGLWAVKVANNGKSTKRYTYGWQRAETLGALVNGVFLVALCVTIFLDAMSRFFEPQEVSAPKVMLIVGCLGLASNILGLLLFHDHSHSHGPGGHSHSDAEAVDEQSAAEEGLANPHDHAHSHETTESNQVQNNGEPLAHKTSTASRSKHGRSHSRPILNSLDSIPTNPHAIRNSVVSWSHAPRNSSDAEDNQEDAVANDIDPSNSQTDDATTGLLNGKHGIGYGAVASRPVDHTEHFHAQPKSDSKGGHSHADLNMRGIFLHVMGDALGNLGVIATALVIWLTDYSWRFYFDPAISLVITCIILASAIPLCKAASAILLQAVPKDIDVEEIRADILSLPDVIGVHDLHVWQLSDTKKIASLHVQVDFDFKGQGSARYMRLAQEINNCLHAYGIHSSTVQPEFCLDPEHVHKQQEVGDGAYDDSNAGSTSGKRSKSGSRLASKPGSVHDHEHQCLLGCADPGCGGKSCCPPASTSENGNGNGGGSGHGGHDHSH